MRGLRLLSNLLWTSPLVAFTWWVVPMSWDGIASGTDRGGAAAASAAFSLVLLGLSAFCVWFAVKDWRAFDAARPSARNDLAVILFCQLVIGLMIATVLPAWFGLLTVSAEGMRKADLQSLRAAFATYAAAKGRPPRLEALVEAGAIERLPRLRSLKPHAPTRETVNLEPGVFTDSGRWGYSVEASTPIFVDCTHTDHRLGVAWNSY